MMTQQLRAGILSAPLAAIDRRSLSQAWYSALGYAGQRTAPGTRSCRRAASGAAEKETGTGITRPETAASRRVWLRPCTPPGAKRDASASLAAPERRASPSALGRAIARRFARASSPPARATFSLDGGRVHVLLRDSGREVRLIALCAPGARVAVARALEQARYALAARGITLGIEAVASKGRM